MTFWKRQSDGDGKKNNRKKGGEINKHSTEDFKSSETALYDTVMMYTCHYMLIQSHKTYKAKSEPQTSGDMMCQHRCINCG